MTWQLRLRQQTPVFQRKNKEWLSWFEVITRIRDNAERDPMPCFRESTRTILRSTKRKETLTETQLDFQTQLIFAILKHSLLPRMILPLVQVSIYKATVIIVVLWILCIYRCIGPESERIKQDLKSCQAHWQQECLWQSLQTTSVIVTTNPFKTGSLRSNNNLQ